MSGHTVELSHRAMALLRAVAAQRVHMSCSCEPDLFIDGVACCDQMTAHELARNGFIRPTVIGVVGKRVPAELTDAGRAALTERPAA
ncbi:hypothetical protein CFN78_15040 [Amycolatopsis antarctica]|uniref:Uncharacterized protein n=1 Tax=Amycolatopsis antarctica TaxID=1854586 RepID=A0A263D1J2_9PSEU|nr:hypothetical protein [Amycolatopsis antarctica]OZM72323.1 hypothetical protein CFN78_15040 [Amycolatopsis antarctica]